MPGPQPSARPAGLAILFPSGLQEKLEVSLSSEPMTPRLSIPQPKRSQLKVLIFALAATGDGAAIRAEGHAVNRIAMTIALQHARPRHGIPQSDDPVIVSTGKEATIWTVCHTEHTSQVACKCQHVGS
mmetsp:Transcript_4952/g.10932  ORF Transcript_4952/g.10932 Transcript_4952/m.10932 type:complete len:128 (-) Transcript_4952:169-552(-)